MSLLNLQNIPNGEISGLDDEILAWVTEESNCRYVEELSGGFLSYLNNEEGDATDISQEIINDLNKIEIEGIPQSSVKQMNDNVKRFVRFLTDKNLSTDLKNIPITVLNNYLRYFYAQLRTADDKFYAPATLICIRAGLHRHFMLFRPDVNIIGDVRFAKANRMLVSMVRKFKASCQPKRNDVFPAIEKNDLRKMMQHFDRSNGEILQQEVMFHLIYHFGLRGRETLPHLSKSSFHIFTDSDGLRYVALNHELLSKNAKASLKTSEHEDLKKARMYACPDDVNNCPVVAFELYMDKITKIDNVHLFPKPCKNLSKGKASRQWFAEKQTVGKNTIDCLMSRLSESLALSKRYTNHSIRVTHITVLKENGFTNSEIAANTGHKNAESIERYNRKRRDVDFASMSTALTMETSSRNVTVKKVGKLGKVIVEETQCLEKTSLQQPSVDVHLHFTGSFQNCTFQFDKF